MCFKIKKVSHKMRYLLLSIEQENYFLLATGDPSLTIAQRNPI